MLRERFLSTATALSALLLAAAPTAAAIDSAPIASSSAAASASRPGAWYGAAWSHVEETWEGGGLELYAPFYTLHMPYAYTPALLRSYNDFPAGGGIGKGRFNKNGNWEGLFAVEFADSHKKTEYEGGYAWIATWHPFANGFRTGAGFTALITARSDIFHYTPFPGALPLGSIGYANVDLQTTFVPGGRNDGNVMLFWLKLSFY